MFDIEEISKNYPLSEYDMENDMLSIPVSFALAVELESDGTVWIREWDRTNAVSSEVQAGQLIPGFPAWLQARFLKTFEDALNRYLDQVEQALSLCYEQDLE